MNVISPLELADAIASYIMDQKYPDGWMVNEIPGDERSTLRPDPELEDEYGDLYVDAEEMIRKSGTEIPDEELEGIEDDIETIHWALVAYVEDSAGADTPEALALQEAWDKLLKIVRTHT